MASRHLQDNVQQHIAEISAFIEAESNEIGKMSAIIEEKQQSIRDAIADRERHERALAALRGDDEKTQPSSGMLESGIAVVDRAAGLRAAPTGPGDLDRHYGGSKHPTH